MTLGAGTFPLCRVFGYVGSVDALVPIANLTGFLFPDLAVTGGLTCQRMSNLVQQNLVHEIEVSPRYQVL